MGSLLLLIFGNCSRQYAAANAGNKASFSQISPAAANDLDQSRDSQAISG
jgi:hypothetical protein